MNEFTYKLLILQQDSKLEYLRKKIENQQIVKNNTRFTVKTIIFDQSDDMSDMFFQGIIIPDRISADNLVSKIIHYNNQAEIFLTFNSDSTGNEQDNIARIQPGSITAKFIIEMFYRRRYSTPLYQGTRELTGDSIRFYTPGHIRGASLKRTETGSEMYHYYGSHIFSDDISVSDMRPGSLLTHTSLFLEAERMIASAYSVKEAFIGVQGTSTSNKVVITTLANTGDKIIIDRNIHKSVVHSAIIAGAVPVFIKSNYNSLFNILMPGRKEDIIEAIENNKDAKLLVLTSPTYEGIIYNLTEIIEHAHRYGIKVFVDSAWGSHLHFNHHYYPDAVQCGADYIVHSFHKTLTAFSMATVTLVNDPDFAQMRNDFIENYLMFASTSPFYPIASSMDIARRMMSVEGKKILHRIMELYTYASGKISRMSDFRVMDTDYLRQFYTVPDDITIDYTKLTVGFNKSNVSKSEIVRKFNDFNIIPEKINDFSFTVLILPGTTKNDIDKLAEALLSRKRTKRKIIKKPQGFDFDDLTIEMNPQEAYFKAGEWIDVDESENRISSVLIVPYPPGIPLVIPGQRITEVLLSHIKHTISMKGIEMHGVLDNKIKVVK